MNPNRLIPLLIPVLIFLCDEIYFFYPKLIYVCLSVVTILIFFALWQLSRSSNIDKAWWNYLILPTIISASIMAYSILLINRTLIQFLFIFNFIFLFLYLRQVYYYLLNPMAYEVFSIESLSSYINWLAFFLLSAALYGLESYLNLPIFWLMIINLITSAFLVYQIIWANKINLRVGLPYILISCLLLIELFWSISFSPFNYNISGFILAICYYVIIGLIKNHLLSTLDTAKIKIYLLVGGLSLFLVLLTARWV